jgi:hypothetical protein
MDQANTIRTPIAIVALCLTLAALPSAFKSIAIKQTNIDVIARFLAQHTDQRDFIVVNPWFYGLTFQHYYRGAASWKTMPALEPIKVHRYDLLMERMAADNPNDQLFESIRSTLRDGGHVWIVGGLAAPPDGTEAPELPPAPGGPHGWYSGDYLAAWTLQLGAFLRSHDVDVSQIDLPLERPASGYESADLYSLEGWNH